MNAASPDPFGGFQQPKRLLYDFAGGRIVTGLCLLLQIPARSDVSFTLIFSLWRLKSPPRSTAFYPTITGTELRSHPKGAPDDVFRAKRRALVYCRQLR
jgi:hypothetical protein